MSHVSYSQSGEDMVLRYLLKADGIDLNAGGFFVDVGAHHPRRFSNTKFFYDLGWSGINLDPNIGIKKLFDMERPRDTSIEKGVSDKKELKKFYEYNDSALNSVNDRSNEFKGTKVKLEQVREVEFTTLSDVLEENQKFDFDKTNFLSIDVEGHEIAVLFGNKWEYNIFHYVLVEEKYNEIGMNNDLKICNFLNEIGYIFIARTGLTSFYKLLT
tara:strand:+ start:1700 stop:2341 length:642 start_codon:yes stop_codon:yes gene_type:complete